MLANHIQKDPHFAETEWTHFRDDLQKPVLRIKPKNLPGEEYENVKTSFVINVIPMLPASTFKLSKLMPDKANLHSHHGNICSEKERKRGVGGEKRERKDSNNKKRNTNPAFLFFCSYRR